MFHTTLLEIAGNTSPTSGKKSGSKGNSNSMRNNFEFQKLLRDVETEMNLIRIGAGGRGRSDAHPKMAKTVELVSLTPFIWSRGEGRKLMNSSWHTLRRPPRMRRSTG